MCLPPSILIHQAYSEADDYAQGLWWIKRGHRLSTSITHNTLLSSKRWVLNQAGPDLVVRKRHYADCFSEHLWHDFSPPSKGIFLRNMSPGSMESIGQWPEYWSHGSAIPISPNGMEVALLELFTLVKHHNCANNGLVKGAKWSLGFLLHSRSLGTWREA